MFGSINLATLHQIAYRSIGVLPFINSWFIRDVSVNILECALTSTQQRTRWSQRFDQRRSAFHNESARLQLCILAVRLFTLYGARADCVILSLLPAVHASIPISWCPGILRGDQSGTWNWHFFIFREQWAWLRAGAMWTEHGVTGWARDCGKTTTWTALPWVRQGNGSCIRATRDWIMEIRDGLGMRLFVNKTIN